MRCKCYDGLLVAWPAQVFLMKDNCYCSDFILSLELGLDFSAAHCRPRCFHPLTSPPTLPTAAHHLSHSCPCYHDSHTCLPPPPIQIPTLLPLTHLPPTTAVDRCFSLLPSISRDSSHLSTPQTGPPTHTHTTAGPWLPSCVPRGPSPVGLEPLKVRMLPNVTGCVGLGWKGGVTWGLYWSLLRYC